MNDMTPVVTAKNTRNTAIPARKGLVLCVLCLGVLIAQVDTSVVNLAMQPIGMALHASVSALQWVLDAYNLTYAALLLTGGLMGDRWVLGQAATALPS
jgi:DHA2 family methylenomycin A resistance protein-like MFS transporter